MANSQVFSNLAKQLASNGRSLSINSARQASTQKVAVPLQLHGLEGRYATAIYTAAAKKNALDAVDKDFQGLITLFKQDKRLTETLRNPVLSKEQKQNAVNELSTKRQANQLTVNTLSLLAENGRLGRLPGIANAFASLMSAHRGEVQARVTSAKSLDQAQLKELQSVLQTFVKKGHSLKVETKVDPALIGGFIVEIGDRYVDLSISSKVKVYDQIIKETI